MANKSITSLAAATVPLAGTETFPVYQGSTTAKITRDQLFTPAVGKGMNFSANTPAGGMTEQVLKIFEEGTWTPTDVSGASLVFVAKSGYYTRVGRLVTVHMQVQYPATSSTTVAKIGGLPFTAASSPPAQGAGWGYTNGPIVQSLVVNAGTATLSLYGGSGAAVTNANMTSSYNWVSFSYII